MLQKLSKKARPKKLLRILKKWKNHQKQQNPENRKNGQKPRCSEMRKIDIFAKRREILTGK